MFTRPVRRVERYKVFCQIRNLTFHVVLVLAHLNKVSPEGESSCRERNRIVKFQLLTKVKWQNCQCPLICIYLFVYLFLLRSLHYSGAVNGVSSPSLHCRGQSWMLASINAPGASVLQGWRDPAIQYTDWLPWNSIQGERFCHLTAQYFFLEPICAIELGEWECFISMILASQSRQISVQALWSRNKKRALMAYHKPCLALEGALCYMSVYLRKLKVIFRKELGHIKCMEFRY